MENITYQTRNWRGLGQAGAGSQCDAADIIIAQISPSRLPNPSQLPPRQHQPHGQPAGGEPTQYRQRPRPVGRPRME